MCLRVGRSGRRLAGLSLFGGLNRGRMDRRQDGGSCGGGKSGGVARALIWTGGWW